MQMTRRGFFAGAAAVTAGAVMGADGTDDNLSVFFSDIHISGIGVKVGGSDREQPTYQNPLLDKAIDQVLAMRPRPKRVVVFGDVALWHGWARDYAESAPKLKRLSDAGIEVTVTTGNHDHREQLFAAYPVQREKTPVPGRVTSVVDLGGADLLLLDTLDENPKGEGTRNPVAGTLDAAQAEWLKARASSAARPFFVGGHHPPQEITVDKKPVLAFLNGCRFFSGYIHGHNHKWYTCWTHVGYKKNVVLRIAGLPSTGWWGSIGFTTFRTFADRAELAMADGSDFFFPHPLAAGQPRPAQWDDLVAEQNGARCIFRYNG